MRMNLYGVIKMRNISGIADIKRNMIDKICDLAEKSEIVRRVIVFGSAADGTCTDESDVDICFDISCDTKGRATFHLSREATRICDYNCDIFFYNLIGNKLKREIDEKGVIVYEH